MDAWYEENDKIEVHQRDPSHRVEVRRGSRQVRVSLSGEVVAETDRPKVLAETGLPLRYYMPFDDVHRHRLQPSVKHTRCPYKGEAAYYDVRVGEEMHKDIFWVYETPRCEAGLAAGHLCTDQAQEGVVVEVNGQVI